MNKYRNLYLSTTKFFMPLWTIIKMQDPPQVQQKVSVFTGQTQTRKTIFPTLITTFGVKKNDYSMGPVQAEVTLSDLFTRG